MIVRHKAISLLQSFQSALQVPNVLSRNNCIFHPSCCIFAYTVKIPSSCSSNRLFVRCGFCPSILIPPSNSSSRACDLATTQSLLAFRSTSNSVWSPPPPAQGTCCPLWIVGGRRFNTKNWLCPKASIKVFLFQGGFWVVLRIRFFEFSSSGAPWEKGFCGISGLVGLKVEGNATCYINQMSPHEQVSEDLFFWIHHGLLDCFQM